MSDVKKLNSKYFVIFNLIIEKNGNYDDNSNIV